MISFLEQFGTDSGTVIAPHKSRAERRKSEVTAVRQIGQDQYAQDLDRAENDPCFFCAMGELAAGRMNGD
jgi:hypothetical protein